MAETVTLYYGSNKCGDDTRVYFRKNDILMCGRDILSFDYDFNTRELSDTEKKYLMQASEWYFEEE